MLMTMDDDDDVCMYNVYTEVILRVKCTRPFSHSSLVSVKRTSRLFCSSARWLSHWGPHSAPVYSVQTCIRKTPLHIDQHGMLVIMWFCSHVCVLYLSSTVPYSDCRFHAFLANPFIHSFIHSFITICRAHFVENVESEALT